MTDIVTAPTGTVGKLLIALAAVLALSGVGEAGNRFVSGSGSDSNPCSLPAPCRSLQRAVDLSAANDEVHVLTSGGYGNTLTVNKSVSIIAKGADAIIVPGGISINNASAVVTLEGLHLSGAGVGSDGISVVAAAAVHIEDCTIERYTSNAMKLTASTATKLFVSNTIARENGSGLFVDAANAKVVVVDSRFERNAGYGLNVHANRISVTRSVSSANGESGFLISGGTADVTDTIATDNASSGFYVYDGEATFTSSTASGNATGLSILAGTSAVLTQSVITHNVLGIYNAGTLWTLKNNALTNNTNFNYNDTDGGVFHVVVPF